MTGDDQRDRDQRDRDQRDRDQRDREIAARARELFRDSVAGLDGRTRSRLALARESAIEAHLRNRIAWPGRPAMLAAAGGLAAAVIAAAVFWQTPDRPLDPAIEVAVFEDWELLLEGESIELFEELDFYSWLLEQPEVRSLIEEDGSG